MLFSLIHGKSSLIFKNTPDYTDILLFQHTRAKQSIHFAKYKKMSFYSRFYRSLFYLHALVALSEFILSFTLYIIVVFSDPELFFKIKNPDDDNWDLIDENSRILMLVLFVMGTIRTVILFVFLFGIALVSCGCCCIVYNRNLREGLVELSKAKATHRFISFNCNCPCYRARPKLRFQLQFLFIILVSGIRIGTIVYYLSLPNHIGPKSLAVIVGISLFFLILTSILDYYHYRMWWHYKPNINNLDIELPTTPLSKKHKRYLPYQLLGSHRTGEYGDKLCSNKPCTNRQLEHILIFHLSDYQPQPRWSELKQRNPSAKTYIGFHRTTAKSALLIAHSEFRRSTSRGLMLGSGIYFARSIKHTDRKARFEGAIIAAEVRMGNVKEVSWNELHTVRDTDRWHPEFDTIYYNHQNDERDEFCIYDESQILRWIIVIDGKFDDKIREYGMYEEFDDTKCYCI